MPIILIESRASLLRSYMRCKQRNTQSLESLPKEKDHVREICLLLATQIW